MSVNLVWIAGTTRMPIDTILVPGSQGRPRRVTERVDRDQRVVAGSTEVPDVGAAVCAPCVLLTATLPADDSQSGERGKPC